MSRRERPWRRIGPGLLYAGAVALALNACSSSSEGFFRQMGDRAAALVGGAKEAPRRQLSRAELNQIPYATIAVSSDDGPPAYLVANADNGGYLDYRDDAGNAVRILGGAVAGLATSGYDLDAVLFDRDDPIAHPRPLASWPGRVWRQYQFARRHLGPYVVALDCVFESAGPATIEVAELSYNLIRMNEICTNARRQVTNAYWVDPRNGYIWKSAQWLGPNIGQVSVEVIRPYSG